MRKFAKAVAVAAAMYVGLGLVPYAVSPFGYRSGAGFLGAIDGAEYRWIYADRTHYQSFKMLVFSADYIAGGPHTVQPEGAAILLDGKPVDFRDSRVMLLKNDGSTVDVGWNKEWFVTNTKFSSGVAGVLGPVPHFKSYEVEGPNYEVFPGVIAQHIGGSAE